MGGCASLLHALIAITVMDYDMGMMCTVVGRKLSSEVGFKGELLEDTDRSAYGDCQHL